MIYKFLMFVFFPLYSYFFDDRTIINDDTLVINVNVDRNICFFKKSTNKIN